MLKKLSRFTALLLTVALFCFLLSPAALAAENKSTCGQSGYAAYQQFAQILLQNVNTCQKNTVCPTTPSSTQATEYKTTQTCPQPAQSCKQNSGSQNTASCPQTQTVKPAQTNKPAQTTKPAETTPNNQTNTTAGTSVANYAAEVVRLVNAERAKNNLAPLTMDSQLSAAAQIRAVEANTKFSHTRPNGSSCFTALKEQGISYRRAGENIAIGQSSPAQVVKAWMDSPGHRANILGDYTKIGVGVQQASGSFSGYSWAQFFTK